MMERNDPGIYKGHAARLTYNASLDGVRTIAIVFVLLFHTQRPDGNVLLSGGFIGVELFFVLSGYLITALLLREHDTYGGISIRAFYIRRALRLFPALWLFLLTATVYVALQSDRTHAEQVRSGIIATFFYVSNWIAVRYDNPFYFLNHTWSLAIEEQFYLLWPWMLIVAVKRLSPGKMLVVTALMVLAAVVLQGYYFHVSGTFLRSYAGTDSRAAGLLIGAMLAMLLRSGRGIPGARYISFLGALSLFSLAVIAVFAEYDRRYMYFGVLTVVSICSATLILALETDRRSGVSRFLGLSPLRYVGKISYGLYLWHFPVFQIVHEYRDDFGPIAAGFLSWAISLAIATISYFCVERWFLSRKQQLASGSTRPGAPSSSSLK